MKRFVLVLAVGLLTKAGFAEDPLIRLDFNDKDGAQSMVSRGSLAAFGAFLSNATFSADFSPVNGGGFSGDFNANKRALAFGDLSGTDALQSFTLCGWFNRQGDITSAARHLAIDYSSNAGFYWDLNTSTQLLLRVNSAGVVNASTAAIGLNEWTFLAVTYDGTQTSGNVKFYKAVEGGTLSLLGSALTLNQGATGDNAASLYFGGYTGNNQFFPGKLDNLRMYGSTTNGSGALSLSDLQAVMGEVDCSSDGAHKSFYWIVGSKNILFSEQILRHIAGTGYRYIVLGIGRDGYVDSADTVYYGRYEPYAVYDRLKELNGNGNVMCYMRSAWDYIADMTSREVYETAQYSTNEYVKNYDLTAATNGYVVTDSQVYPYTSGYCLDWAQSGVKSKFLDAIHSAYTNINFSFDGVMFDSFVRDPTLAAASIANSYKSYLNQGKVTASEYDQMILDYQDNVEDFVSTLNHFDEIPVMFNSINYRTTNYAQTAQITIDRYNNRPPLLALTTGATIELFGCYEKGPMATDANLLKLMSLTHDYPGNYFLYMGRPKFVMDSVTYQGYEEDYDWYRYIYGQYLIGMAGTNGNSSFKYWPHGLLEPNPTMGRLFCYETMGDQEFDLGAPLQTGWATNTQSVYCRLFENGIVVLNPHDKGDGSSDYWKNTTGKTLYDIDGSWAGVYSNNVNIWLYDGTAKILSFADRDARYDRWIDFEQVNHWAGYMENASIETDFVTDHKYLSLGRMTNGIHQEHDIALYMTKYRNLTNSAVLKMDVRASGIETNARIIAVAEVDDSALTNRQMFVGFECRNYGWGDDGSYVIGSNSLPKLTEANAMNFRAKDRMKIFYVPVQTWGQPDWHMLEIDPVMQLNNADVMDHGTNTYSGRFTFRRWVFVRFIGGMDIDYIQAGPCTNESVIIRDSDY